jgi:DNA-binding NtrC family response regulator
LQLPTSTPALDGEDAFADLLDLPLTEAKKILIESFERRMIENALAREEQNVSAAARRLGMHRQNLQQKIQQLGIQRATR